MMTTILFWRAEGLDEDQSSTRIGSKHDARFAVTAGENIRAMSGRSHPRRYRARRIGEAEGEVLTECIPRIAGRLSAHARRRIWTAQDDVIEKTRFGDLIRLQPRISDQARIHPKWRKRTLCAFDVDEIHDLSRHSIERERLRDQGRRGRRRARARRGRIQECECRAQGECEKRLRRSPAMTALALPNVRHKQSPEA